MTKKLLFLFILSYARVSLCSIEQLSALYDRAVSDCSNYLAPSEIGDVWNWSDLNAFVKHFNDNRSNVVVLSGSYPTRGSFFLFAAIEQQDIYNSENVKIGIRFYVVRSSTQRSITRYLSEIQKGFISQAIYSATRVFADTIPEDELDETRNIYEHFKLTSLGPVNMGMLWVDPRKISKEQVLGVAATLMEQDKKIREALGL